MCPPLSRELISPVAVACHRFQQLGHTPPAPPCSWPVSSRNRRNCARASKPTCDWDDEQATEELIDVPVRDGLEALEGAGRRPAQCRGCRSSLSTDRRHRPRHRADRGWDFFASRVISTVDPETRHGHMFSAHGQRPTSPRPRRRSTEVVDSVRDLGFRLRESGARLG